ncbi:MAG: AAA family ATPase [Opitutales bacterium]|nr:AAA family ATPase [Opitutales bacterium]
MNKSNNDDPLDLNSAEDLLDDFLVTPANVEDPLQKSVAAGVEAPRVACGGGGERVLTASQGQCVRRAFKMARLYFAGQVSGASANLLMVGPTGCGKSAVLDEIAERLNLRCLRLTRATCIPLGAEVKPTLVSLLEAFLEGGPVLLHIDELDKFFVQGEGSGWERSNLDMIWNLLDRRISAGPVADSYLKKVERKIEKRSLVECFEEGLRSKLFIIGSGTWQQLQNRRQVGFPGEFPKCGGDPIDLRATKAVPDEILRRFYADVSFLAYPTPAELRPILKAAGIFDLARQLGETVDPANLDLSGVGMAAIRDLRTRLLLRLLDQSEEPSGGAMSLK